LECTNTNTVLPYIDLVNELLERELAGGLDGSSYQTTWTTAELRLHPEHLDTSLYNGTSGTALAHRVPPCALPFSLPVLEGRLYLEHLGVARHALMGLLINDDTQIAAEVFGMSPIEGQIVTGTFAGNDSPDGREFWGFTAGAGTDTWIKILAGTH